MITQEEIGSTQSNELPKDGTIVLDDEATASLVGFFDVLIQMDFEQKRKEKERENNEK